MIKKTAFIGFAFMALLGLSACAKEPEFHVHANFALFLNGERFDFSGNEFMNVAPCTTEEASLFFDSAYAHGDGDLHDFVHLHGNVGNVIHVHKEGITYGDFFESLNMELTDYYFKDHQGNFLAANPKVGFRFFVNGQEVRGIADFPIQDLDRVLVTYGLMDRGISAGLDPLLKELNQVGDDACVYSGTCPERGEAPEESCGS